MDIIDPGKFYSSHVCFTVYLHLSDGVTNISVIKICHVFVFGCLPNLKTRECLTDAFFRAEPHSPKRQKMREFRGIEADAIIWSSLGFKGFMLPSIGGKNGGLINLVPLKKGWEVVTWNVEIGSMPRSSNFDQLRPVWSYFMWIFYGQPLSSLKYPQFILCMQAQNTRPGDDPHGDACEGEWQHFGEVWWFGVVLNDEQMT